MKRIITIIVSLIISGCSPVVDHEAVPNVQTSLEILTEDILRVSYSTSRPTKQLFLKRTPDKQRATRWISPDGKFTIEHEDKVDVIKRTDGTSFDTAAFNIPMKYTTLPKDYAPFMPYRETGMLIHSGRFHVCLQKCDDENREQVFPMKVVAHISESLILLGETLKGTQMWDDQKDGTMIYIGRSKPLETNYVIALVDAALPQDIQDPLDELFPQLMAYYVEKLGALDRKPMLFASLDRHSGPDGNPNSNNFSSQGGTLPGQVFMHFAGDAWFEDEDVRGPNITGYLEWFFAHEAGHLYQRGADYISDENDAWIHEGGADAFAVLALSKLDKSTPAYIQKRKKEAVESCLEGLKKGPLDTAADRGDFDIIYSCGMIIQLSIDKAVRQKSNESSDLFTVWVDFLERVKLGNAWNSATFLDVVESHGGSDVRALSEDIIAANGAINSIQLQDAIIDF